MPFSLYVASNPISLSGQSVTFLRRSFNLRRSLLVGQGIKSPMFPPDRRRSRPDRRSGNPSFLELYFVGIAAVV